MKNCAIAALPGVGRMTKVITTWREHKPCSDDFNRQFSSTEATDSDQDMLRFNELRPRYCRFLGRQLPGQIRAKG